MPKGENTIFFIPRGKLPNGKTITYGHIIAYIRPHKAETHCVCLTVGGYWQKFDGVIETHFAGLVTTKMLFNCTVYTQNANFFTFDINGFYYGIPMEY